MRSLRLLRCWAFHRRWHEVIWTEGAGFPLDMFSYVWFCHRCDHRGQASRPHSFVATIAALGAV